MEVVELEEEDEEAKKELVLRFIRAVVVVGATVGSLC